MVISNKKARKQTEFIVAIDIAADAHTMTASLSSTKSRVSTPANSNEPTFDQIIETEIFKSRPPLELQSKTCAPDKIIMPALKRTNDDDSLPIKDREYLKVRQLVDLVKNELGEMGHELRVA